MIKQNELNYLETVELQNFVNNYITKLYYDSINEKVINQKIEYIKKIFSEYIDKQCEIVRKNAENEKKITGRVVIYLRSETPKTSS